MMVHWRTGALFIALSLVACSDSDGSTSGNGNGFTLGDDLNLSVKPESVNFGAVALNEERTLQVTLQHIGTSGVLRLTNVQLDTESPDLRIDLPATTELEPGASTTLDVIYTPSDGALDEGTLLIGTNVPRTEGGTLTYEVPILTLPQKADLISEPFLHDFGPVESATSSEQTLTIRNIGELPFSVESLSFKDDASDFKVLEAPQWPATFNAGDEFSVTVAYAPTGYNADTDWLQINGSSLKGDESFEVELRGHEVWGQLRIDPDIVDFGLQIPGQVHTRTVTLINEGSTTLRIHETEVLALSPWSHTIGIVGVQGADETLEIGAGDSVDVEVTFLPDPYMEPSTGPVATVSFHSNDPKTQGIAELPVFGKRRGPGLEVFPPDQVYFGFVGEGGTVARNVSLYNASMAPITVEKMWIEGDFEFAEGEDWGPILPAPLPVEIPSGETKELSLVFTHEGGDWTTSWGKLQIDSNDLLKPYWEVLLQARAATKSPCLLQIVPENSDFGLVLAGESKTIAASLVNIGGTACGFAAGKIDDCDGESECISPEEDAPFESTSAHFTLTGLPDVAADNIAPGEGVDVEITFTAPSQDELPAHEIANFYALLSLQTSSTDANGETVTSVVPDFITWGSTHNVRAKAAVAQLIANPPLIDFDEVPIGCQSEPHVITATNIGVAPLGISDWGLIDCPDTFKIVDYPVLDDPTPNGTFVSKLYENETAEFLVAYEPLSEEPESCTLAIYHTASEEPTTVELVGQGTYVTDQTDVFTDSATQDVDVLFVVDDSGSMSSEQQNLAKSFDAFIKKAAEWKSNFQIGVVTTTLEFPTAGVLQGSPAFVTNANWEKFINNVQVGTNGSGTEQGLWAAKVALGAPTTDVTDEPCVEDSDCGFLHVCMNGFCGGPNQHFIREDASLELVFVSDEEDQSPESTDEYLKFFRGLKGFDKPDQMHVHAIVGPAGGCESEAGAAVAGHPYLELAQATGGVTYSICESDFSKGLESIGEVAFSAKMRYFLTKYPAPTTIQVTIDGYPCPLLTLGTFNWSYDPLSNSVQLAENSICKAEPGSIVEITYKLLCFAD